jgi:hypothetical protein
VADYVQFAHTCREVNRMLPCESWRSDEYNETELTEQGRSKYLEHKFHGPLLQVRSIREHSSRIN